MIVNGVSTIPVYTMADYRELVQAYNSGMQRVKYQDREVWYKSNDEMLQVIRRMEAALGINAGTPAPARRSNTVFSKGL
jgi:hypothetical protein